MLTTLKVSGYRSFLSYEADDLRRVNLFVGPNDSGKTSLLEAIEFLVAHGDPAVLLRIAERRGETRSIGDPDAPPSQPLADLTHVFHGHDLRADPAPRIELSGDPPYGSITAAVRRLTPAERRSDLMLDAPGGEVPFHGLEITGDTNGDYPILPVDSDGALVVTRRHLSLGDLSPHSRAPRTQFLTPRSLDIRKMVDLWNRVQRAALEDEVVAAVRLVAEDLRSIHFLSSSPLPQGVEVLAGLRDGRRVPLGSQGDGMRRVLALSLSIINSADGFLFVDELGSGLHWAVMRDLWQFVVQAAKQFSVQVFATTHSFDCIRGLASLRRKEPELAAEVSVFKLDRRLNEAIGIDAKGVEIAVDQNIELR